VRRGEVWTYQPPTEPARERTVVLLSSDGVNDSERPWLLGTELLDRDPQDILGVALDSRFWVSTLNLTRLYRPWLNERIAEINQEVQEQIDVALRAALDL
jgi:mRNA-degrading endonuclease toxin of MazEF toxin-antitoxin module